MGASKDEQTVSDARPVEGMSYTEASAELDSIVGFFEGREVDVDQLVGQLVRATAIIEELDKRLRRTRTQVEQLVPRLAAVLGEVTDGAPAEAPEPGPGEPEPDEPAYEPFEDDTSAQMPDDELSVVRGSARGGGEGEDDSTPGLF